MNSTDLSVTLWNINIYSVYISKTIGVISKSRKFLNKPTLLTLYNSIILPYLQYCTFIWGSTYKTHLHSLLLCKKKVARIVTYSPPLSHSKPLFLELHILNIHLIYNYQLACFVFQHINHLLPLPVSSLFQFNYHIHNYSTRHKHDLHILSHKHSYLIRTQGPKCWNALPLSLRQSLRTHNYKKILKKYYLSLINTSDL